jgi:hypothetical protein
MADTGESRGCPGVGRKTMSPLCWRNRARRDRVVQTAPLRTRDVPWTNSDTQERIIAFEQLYSESQITRH